MKDPVYIHAGRLIQTALIVCAVGLIGLFALIGVSIARGDPTMSELFEHQQRVESEVTYLTCLVETRATTSAEIVACQTIRDRERP